MQGNSLRWFPSPSLRTGNPAARWRRQPAAPAGGPESPHTDQPSRARGQRSGIPFKKLRRLAVDHPIKGCDPLLPIQNQADISGRQGTVSAGNLRICRGVPNQQAAYRISAVQRVHQLANLIPIPDIAALKDWKRIASQIDLAENQCRLYLTPRFNYSWEKRREKALFFDEARLVDGPGNLSLDRRTDIQSFLTAQIGKK